MNPTACPTRYSVSEWHSVELDGIVLTDEDRALIARLCSESESRLSIAELRGSLLISARSWVGVIRFHHFELHIEPKLVGDHLQLVELIDYATGIGALDRHPAERTLKEGGSSLFDIIALLFVETCERLVRGGLLTDYVEVEDDIPVIRGKLLLEKQILRRFGRIDRLQCRYDEYMTDIIENQILLAGLSVCARRVSHPDVAMRVRRLVTIFSEVCELRGLDLRLTRASLVYNRMNGHYLESHGLAWLIFDGLGIDDVFAAGSRRCFAFLLDMNKLFEGFISRWLQQVLSGNDFHVIPQRRDRTILWNADLSRPYSSVVPDVLIEKKGKPKSALPVDAKYKLYDQRNIATSDIYQTFLYAYAYGESHALLPTAFVLYPASSIDSGLARLHIRRSGGATTAQLTAVPIHIPTALQEARSGFVGLLSKRLLTLINQVFS